MSEHAGHSVLVGGSAAPRTHLDLGDVPGRSLQLVHEVLLCLRRLLSVPLRPPVLPLGLVDGVEELHHSLGRRPDESALQGVLLCVGPGLDGGHMAPLPHLELLLSVGEDLLPQLLGGPVLIPVQHLALLQGFEDRVSHGEARRSVCT